MSQTLSREAAKWIVVGVLAMAALVGLVVGRQLSSPFVGLATQQACSQHGDDLSRPVSSYERQKSLSLLGRTPGSCTFGPITPEEGEDEVTINGETLPLDQVQGQPETMVVSLADFEAGGLYTAMRFISGVLQLGFASIAVRLLADPLLDRFVR